MYDYKAKLLRVVDGDTVDAEIDLGFDVSVKKRIRLVGINTPECRTRDLKEKALGLAAKDRVKAILLRSEGWTKSNIAQALRIDRNTVADYIKEYLESNNITIMSYQDIKACKVFYDNDLVGEWLGPSFVLKKEDGDFYYEITLESWSIEEEGNQNEE